MKKKYQVNVSFTREVEAESDVEALNDISRELTYSSVTEKSTNVSINCYPAMGDPRVAANQALGQPTEAEKEVPLVEELPIAPEPPKARTVTSNDSPF